MEPMYAGRLGTASGRPDMPPPSLTDRLGGLIENSRMTAELLTAQHERLFGPVPAIPQALNAKASGPPSVEDGLGALAEISERIAHVTRCLANRI